MQNGERRSRGSQRCAHWVEDGGRRPESGRQLAAEALYGAGPAAQAARPCAGAAAAQGGEAQVAALGHVRGAPGLAFIGARAGHLTGRGAAGLRRGRLGLWPKAGWAQPGQAVGRRGRAGAGRAFGLGPFQ
jgi:hypothetical protein